MKRILPITVAVTIGLVVLLDFFVANPYLDRLGLTLVRWTMIVSAFALVLGLLNVLSVHLGKLVTRQDGWPYSIALVAAMLTVAVAGLLPGSRGPQAPTVQWLFSNVQVPLQAAVFSLLAFYIATAAYRVLHRRSLESLLLVGTVVVVLLGQAPVARLLWDQLPLVKDWFLAVPATAGMRGILIGVGLGVVTTGLRVVLGFDRPYAE